MPDGVVLDPIGNRKVAGQFKGRKDRLEVGAWKTCGDH
jgi:hypothetical protein